MGVAPGGSPGFAQPSLTGTDLQVITARTGAKNVPQVAGCSTRPASIQTTAAKELQAVGP